MRTLTLLVAFLPLNALADGLSNPGFELADSSWTWASHLAETNARVGSPSDGIVAHGGSFQTKTRCVTLNCYGFAVQTISGDFYRAGLGTLSVWVVSSLAVAKGDPNVNLYASVVAYSASNAELARDDIGIAGTYVAGAAWDMSQRVDLAAGVWKQVTLNERLVLDGKLGSSLAAVDHVGIAFTYVQGYFWPNGRNVFWDDASWPMPAGPVTASPGPGAFDAPLSVALSCPTPSSTIRFTTDGTTPTSASPPYSSPIPITYGAMTIKAICQATLTPLPAWGSVSYTYLQCYAAALFLEKHAGKGKLLAVVHRTLKGEPFERVLDQELRMSTADLDRAFLAWVEHL